MARAPLTAAAAATGAALAYFLDPAQGRRRRAQAAQQAAALIRRPTRRAMDRMSKKTRIATDRAVGLAYEAARPEEWERPENEQVLINKIRSEILGREEWRHYTLNIDAADGVVSLRGQLDRPEQINALRRQVADVPGVTEVKSYLHLPNTTPPNVQDAEAASGTAARRSDGGMAIE